MVTKLNPEVIAEGSITADKINIESLKTDSGVVTQDVLKTVNGESIIGSGDITISGGNSSGGGEAYSEINHGTDDTTCTLTPNTFHIWDEVSSLTLTLGDEQSGVANEYLFQFNSGSVPTTLSLPDNIKWIGDLTIESNKVYQISILKGLGNFLSWEIDVPAGPIVFYVNDVEYNAESGMTWIDFESSEYNTQEIAGETGHLCSTSEPYDVYWVTEDPEEGIVEKPLFETYESIDEYTYCSPYDTIIANHNYIATFPW